MQGNKTDNGTTLIQATATSEPLSQQKKMGRTRRRTCERPIHIEKKKKCEVTGHINV